MSRKGGIGRFIFKVLLWCFGVSVLWVVALKFVPVYFTPLMIIRAVEQKSDGKEMKCHHKWVPLSEINTSLPLAVVSSEDNLYMEHHGFDFKAIGDAIEEAREGKRQRGGSTISQQTAKNVFLWPGHSFVRKGLEAYFTVLIELIWGKERIMEVYLNSIEMGDGIYGAEAVANDNFGKCAKNLTRAESARIAATLPNPRRFDSAHPSKYILRRTGKIQRLMRLVENPQMGYGAKKAEAKDKKEKKKK